MIKKALQYQQNLTGDSFIGTIKRYVIFVIGGFAGWLLLIGVHSFLGGAYNLNPLLSYAVGVVFADIFTFIYHRLVTFRIKTNWRLRFAKFSVMVVLISIVNWGLFSIGRVVLDLPMPDFVMSFVITTFLSVLNFGINRVLIFRHS